MTIENTIIIDAAPDVVWRFLTEPELMKQWMGEKEMDIKVETDWKVGNPITITGFHHANFQNTGIVVDYNNQERLSYSHLSSLSGLPDVLENYSSITFLLETIDQNTQLTLHIENFPTETIYRHMEFYWRGTLSVLKDFIECAI